MAFTQKRFTKVDPYYCPPIDGEKIRRRHKIDIVASELQGSHSIEWGVVHVTHAVEERCELCGQTVHAYLYKQARY